MAEIVWSPRAIKDIDEIANYIAKDSLQYAEYSPGRRDLKYLGDRSAFDVFIEYLRDDKKGFIGIEVKYAESLREGTKAVAETNDQDRYTVITNKCGLFKDG